MPTAPEPPEPTEQPGELPSIEALLNRPTAERAREYRYRLAQTLVFGLPVIGLAVWGSALGPRDAQRWSTVFQALLAGWVLYVNAGMLIEGLMRSRVTSDLLITVAAVVVYVWSLIGVAFVLTTGSIWPRPTLFWGCIALLGAWNALRFAQLSRRQRT